MTSYTKLSNEVKLHIWFVSASLLFFIALQVSYVKFVVPFFSYKGFDLDFNYIRYFESWAIFSLMLLLSPKRFNVPSDFLIIYLIFSYFTPLLVLYGLSNQSRYPLYIVALCVVLINFIRLGRPFRLKYVKNGKALSVSILLGGAAIVTLSAIFSGGLAGLNFNLANVYNLRDVQSDRLSFGIMSYLNIWATKVFGPAIIAVFLWKKQYLLAITAFGLQVFWFGLMAHKSILFYPLLVFFIWIWSRKNSGLSLVPTALTCVIILSMLIYFISGNIFVASLLIRRVFFVPASLTFEYYEFFGANGFVYWSNSLTKSLIDYPYHLGPAKLIGEYIGSGSNANNSFLATGYMHAGVAGVLVYSVLVGLLFKTLDSMSFKGIPSWVGLAVVLVPAHSLISSTDLPTALLTHGFGVSLVILFLLRSFNHDNRFQSSE